MDTKKKLSVNKFVSALLSQTDTCNNRTGDTAPIAAWSLIIVGAILTLGISAKKRKKEEQ